MDGGWSVASLLSVSVWQLVYSSCVLTLLQGLDDHIPDPVYRALIGWVFSLLGKQLSVSTTACEPSHIFHGVELHFDFDCAGLISDFCSTASAAVFSITSAACAPDLCFKLECVWSFVKTSPCACQSLCLRLCVRLRLRTLPLIDRHSLCDLDPFEWRKNDGEERSWGSVCVCVCLSV